MGDPAWIQGHTALGDDKHSLIDTINSTVSVRDQAIDPQIMIDSRPLCACPDFYAIILSINRIRVTTDIFENQDRKVIDKPPA
jgi:hypothetical protein